LYQLIKKIVSGGLFLAVITAFLCLVSPGRADAATAIYYSVGTDNTDLYSGNASASSGTLTLASSGAAKIGVGDEIREGSNRYYITGRNSSTVFTIQDSAANGGTPGDTNITFSSTPITIYRAFNTIAAAISGSYNSSHLYLAGPPYDLVAGNYQLNWPCYKDAPLDERVELSGSVYTTGAANYIRIYTPVDSSEVGISQRHTGIAGTGFVIKPTYSGTTARILYIHEAYVRVEGIEIDGSSMNARHFRGIYIKDPPAADSDVRIDKVLVHDLTKDNVSADPYDAYAIYFSTGSGRITNSIVYNLTNDNTDPAATVIGIGVNDSSATYYLYNGRKMAPSRQPTTMWEAQAAAPAPRPTLKISLAP
jgi:hypothetical protein